jgi:hypothetical protein
VIYQWYSTYLSTPRDDVRTPDEFPSSEDIHYTVDPRRVSIHGAGTRSLPDGFKLVVPKIEALRQFLESNLKNMAHHTLSRSRNWLSMAASIFQLINASITFYRLQGPELDHYGYAAYGLSVFPYAFMSLVNLICAGVVGEYPSVYVVKSKLLDEMEGKLKEQSKGEKDEEGEGPLFHGIIGVCVPFRVCDIIRDNGFPRSYAKPASQPVSLPRTSGDELL